MSTKITILMTTLILFSTSQPNPRCCSKMDPTNTFCLTCPIGFSYNANTCIPDDESCRVFSECFQCGKCAQGFVLVESRLKVKKCQSTMFKELSQKNEGDAYGVYLVADQFVKSTRKELTAASKTKASAIKHITNDVYFIQIDYEVPQDEQKITNLYFRAVVRVDWSKYELKTLNFFPISKEGIKIAADKSNQGFDLSETIGTMSGRNEKQLDLTHAKNAKLIQQIDQLVTGSLPLFVQMVSLKVKTQPNIIEATFLKQDKHNQTYIINSISKKVTQINGNYINTVPMINLKASPSGVDKQDKLDAIPTKPKPTQSKANDNVKLQVKLPSHSSITLSAAISERLAHKFVQKDVDQVKTSMYFIAAAFAVSKVSKGGYTSKDMISVSVDSDQENYYYKTIYVVNGKKFQVESLTNKKLLIGHFISEREIGIITPHISFKDQERIQNLEQKAKDSQPINPTSVASLMIKKQQISPQDSSSQPNHQTKPTSPTSPSSCKIPKQPPSLSQLLSFANQRQSQPSSPVESGFTHVQLNNVDQNYNLLKAQMYIQCLYASQLHDAIILNVQVKNSGMSVLYKILYLLKDSNKLRISFVFDRLRDKITIMAVTGNPDLQSTA